jgi:DNA-binding NarL/FixJ family response regulator
LDFLRTYDVKTKAPKTVVLALTNMNNPKVEEEAQALGAAGYLDKASYEPLQLVAYVKDLLAKKAA